MGSRLKRTLGSLTLGVVYYAFPAMLQCSIAPFLQMVRSMEDEVSKEKVVEEVDELVEVEDWAQKARRWTWIR